MHFAMPQRVTTTDDLLQAYRYRDLTSGVLCQFSKGLEVSLGAVTIHDGHQWIEVALHDGTVGFVLGPSARGHTTFLDYREDSLLRGVVDTRRDGPRDLRAILEGEESGRLESSARYKQRELLTGEFKSVVKAVATAALLLILAWAMRQAPVHDDPAGFRYQYTAEIAAHWVWVALIL